MLRVNLLPSSTRRSWWAVLGVIGIGLPFVASADYYRYETENGSIAFTDDPERIPERYQDSAEPLVEKSVHDWDRTTRVEPGASKQSRTALPHTAPEPTQRTPEPTQLRESVMTIDAGNGMKVDVPTKDSEPITIEKDILKSDGQKTAKYTIVRQGDKILMEIKERYGEVYFIEP